MDIIQIPTTQTPGAGLGDVVGPASATDNAIVRYDATTGRLLQNSTVTIADSTGAIAGATSLTSPAATALTLATGTSGAAITVLSANNNVGVGVIAPAQKLSINGTTQWAQTDDPGYSGYLTNASTNNAYNPAITRNLIGSTGSTYTIASGDMDAYAGIQFGISGATTNAGNISFFAASGTFATNESVTPVARMFIASTGDVSISSSTAGSASAGALVVTGGLSAGNNGNASYFGGAVSGNRAVSTGVANTNGDISLTINGNSSIGTAARWINQPSSAAYNWQLGTNLSGNWFSFMASTVVDGTTFSTDALKLTNAGAATFAGAVTIGNTVNTVSPTSPNRTITMVVNGVTLYLAAKTTND